MGQPLAILLKALLNRMEVHGHAIRERALQDPPYRSSVFPITVAARKQLGSWKKLLDALTYADEHGVDEAVAKYAPTKKPVPGQIQYEGRNVGKLVNDGKTFFTMRNPATHHCHRHDAYGINVEVLAEVAAKGADTVMLKVDGAIFYVPIVEWERLGIRDTLQAADGPQIFMPVKALEQFTG